MGTFWRGIAIVLALSVSSAACGTDDGASVRDLAGAGAASAAGPASGSGSGSGLASGSGSGSASAVADRETGMLALGEYEPVSDVSAHALVSADVCAINELLDAETIDFDAVRAGYRDGGASVNADGSVRTLAGFATTERDEPIWNAYVAYFDDPAWLDSFVVAAIDGSGPFAGEAEPVRRQGVQKGVMNQILVAWTVHELVAALQKAEAGEIDPAEGAPHNWDEAWAFYHGARPDCAPYATADKRGENFATGSATNERILAAMQTGQDALVAGDVDTARAASEEVLRGLQTTYLQATWRYASQVDAALAAGDAAEARVAQSEGWAFYRVIAPMVAAADADADATISTFYDLATTPAAGGGQAVVVAVRDAAEALGIGAGELGELEA